MNERFQTYCDAVCGRIRCAPLRADVSAELAAHLEDHAEALVAQGVAPDAAQISAVDAMGDPVSLGRSLALLHRPFWYRLSQVAALLAAGLAVTAAVLVCTLLVDQRPLFTPLFPSKTAAETLDYQTSFFDVQAVTTGRVSGAGRLGDYALRAVGEARLVYFPARTYGPQNSVPAYYQLYFLLESRHRNPLLSPPEFPWCRPSLTAGDGTAYSYFDKSARNFSIWRAEETVLTAYHMVSCTVGNPHETDYALHLTAGNGRTVHFNVTLTPWEETT